MQVTDNGNLGQGNDEERNKQIQKIKSQEELVKKWMGQEMWSSTGRFVECNLCLNSEQTLREDADIVCRYSFPQVSWKHFFPESCVFHPL